MNTHTRLKLVAICLLFAGTLFGSVASSQEKKPLDPKAWGGNHAGQPVPEYVAGDECLFCHRDAFGLSWAVDGHARNLRTREDALVLAALLKAQPALDKTAEYVLGYRNVLRLLQKDGYGKFAIASAQAVLRTNEKGEKVAQWHSRQAGVGQTEILFAMRGLPHFRHRQPSQDFQKLRH